MLILYVWERETNQKGDVELSTCSCGVRTKCQVRHRLVYGYVTLLTEFVLPSRDLKFYCVSSIMRLPGPGYK